KGTLNFGSYGEGSQPTLVYGYLNMKEGLDILHIPYKGIQPALTATIAGDVSLVTGSAGVAGELLRSGRLKALAIAGDKRSAQFPDVPTTAEEGFPYLKSSVWYGVFAPAGTPDDLVAR